MAELCREFGISRKTGYKWAKRGRCEAGRDFSDRSHEAHVHPNEVGLEVVGWILKGKKKYPSWGPKKLVVWARKQSGLEKLCAVSTAGQILRRHGLVVSRKHTRRSEIYPHGLTQSEGCNEVWCVDFKGWFKLGDGSRCDPLTITDGHSRFLIRCQAMWQPKMEEVQSVFEAAFRQYGLPRVIRSDNGTPFASVGLRGLTVLSAWWVKLGIRPERIGPGKPYENGSHERMHKTLKAEAANPPAHTISGQQRRFDKFVREFNFERPHEALGQRTPESVYAKSERRYPVRVETPRYAKDAIKRRVQQRGQFKWGGQKVFLGEALAGEEVAFIERSDGNYLVMLYGLELGVFDVEAMEIKALHPTNRRRKRRGHEAGLALVSLRSTRANPAS